MLGYVRVKPSELRMREYDCYRALYCGLCRHMGKCTGQCSRMALSYDFVFLAAVRAALTKETLSQKAVRCAVHPLKKRNIVLNSDTLRYCADASALLTYHKIHDDLLDERGFRRMRARLASVWFGGGYRRAKKRHPELDRTIGATLDELHALERDFDAPPSADAPALIFARLLSCIFSEGLEGSQRRIAESIGASIGHWIYLTDAADDFEKDRKSGSFNPYLRLFGDAPTEEDWQATEMALTQILQDAERAFALIDGDFQKELHEILCNILYLGLPEMGKTILERNRKGESKQHEKSL